MTFLKEHQNVVVAGGLILLLVSACFFAALVFSINKGFRVQEETIIEVTATPKPTVTLPPTSTPTLEPTNTPTIEPTNTPIPEPTDTPEPKVEPTEGYKEKMGDAVQDMLAALKVILNRTKAAFDNPEVANTDEWRDTMNVAFAILRGANDRIQELTPLPSYEDAHEHLINATHHFDKMADLYVEAYNNNEKDLLRQALEELQAGQRDLEKFKDALP